MKDEIDGLLLREGLDDSDNPKHITVGRELRRNGRNICRINGRTVNLTLLRDIGSLLVDVHGQSEHLSLLRVSEHLSLLDRFGGLNQQREELSRIIGQITLARKKLSELRNVEMEKLQRVDLLSFQFNEIHAAALVPGEEVELRSERAKLANVENLAELTDKILAVSGYDENESDTNIATESLGEISELCQRLARIDPNTNNVKVQAESLVDQLQDFVSEVLVYKDGIEFNPSRLNEVEDRLHLIQDLQRKYGSDVEDVIAYGDQAQSELDSIAGNVNLRVRELPVEVETKTKDDVFVKIVVSVQFFVIDSTTGIKDSFYELNNPEGQIQSYVFDSIRSEVPLMELDHVFSQKEKIALAIKNELSETMQQFGFDFIKAGLQKWGLEMQNDVEDGTRWIINEGIADKNKICIVGGSYGGYAALMGVAKSNLYKCAVSFAGVTDLGLLVKESWYYNTGKMTREMIGTERSKLIKTSPVNLAHQIHVPVLLVQGEDDSRVTLEHGTRMDSALRRAGAKHIYIQQKNSDHFLSLAKNRLEFFKAMEKFLSENLDH